MQVLGGLEEYGISISDVMPDGSIVLMGGDVSGIDGCYE